MQTNRELEGDSQDNFVEVKDPAETAMCMILGSAYLGLAKFCWEPLLSAQNWQLFVNVEGFFVTIALLALLIGLRPYLSPCSLQLSNKGIKYQGPYWPQRKTVNWDQVFRMYVSPELVVVLYHPKANSKGIWPLIVQSIYLADQDRIPEVFLKYSPVQPVMLSGPSWSTRLLLIVAFSAVVIWIVQSLVS